MMVIALGVVSMKGVATAGGNPEAPAATAAVEGSTNQPSGAAVSVTSAGASRSSGPSPSAGQAADPTSGASWSANLTGYVWPLKNAVITLPFGPSSWGEFIVDGEHFHDGLDMATQCGDYVYAAHDGVVLAASREYDAYMGWIGDLTPYHNLLDTKHWWNSLPIVVVIDDGDGYRSIYAHEYKVTVSPGQHVKAGQLIGYEGMTGNATGCHVHFGLFSPSQTAAFEMDPAIVAKDLVPAYEIARIDPLLVLPFRCEVEEMRALRPAEAVGCPPLPSPSSSAGASAKT
jgi:murein DD-endopeptidase MepM/ murein hydrolase activator NlpD